MDASAHAVLHVDSVCKSFVEAKVVDQVTFAVRAGEVVGIIGPNGAGKTTLLRMIVGILQPDEGSITVLGHQAGAAAQDLVGYLPEERGLYQRERVGRTLRYLARLKGLSIGQLRGRVRTFLRRMGLADQWDQRVQKLSKGQQQKIQFAAAIITDPALVLLDEPFSGLDPLNRHLVVQMVRALAAAGKAVLLSTHEMSRVESLCDRVVMLHRGRTVLVGELSALRRAHAADSLLVQTSADLGRLPGVASVERHNGCLRVRLAAGTSREQLLARLVATGAQVTRFEQETPTIEDIFIDQVREQS